MKSILLFVGMFLIGSDVWACGCPEGREDECKAQHDASIQAECEAGKNRKYKGKLAPLCPDEDE